LHEDHGGSYEAMPAIIAAGPGPSNRSLAIPGLRYEENNEIPSVTDARDQQQREADRKRVEACIRADGDHESGREAHRISNAGHESVPDSIVGIDATAQQSRANQAPIEQASGGAEPQQSREAGHVESGHEHQGATKQHCREM